MINYTIFDYETYYEERGRDGVPAYSLKNMPTQEYVLDDRWHCYGVAVYRSEFVEDEPIWKTRDLHLGHCEADVLVGHNLLFDETVRRLRYGGNPAPFYIDTMLLARYWISQSGLPATLTTSLKALAEHYDLPRKGDTAEATAAGGEALAEYAKHDVWLTKQLLHRLLPDVPSRELRLMDLHVRMASDPYLRADPELLQAEVEAGHVPEELKKAVSSSDQFADLLRRCGVEPETKPGKRGPTYAFAKTDAFMQRLEHHPDPQVRKLRELRLAAKSTIGTSRAQRLLACTHRGKHPLGVPLLYYGAHTGRASGLDKLNLQNLPTGGRIRRALQAPEGYMLVICDSGQIEPRALAWLAGAQAFLRLFREADTNTGPDVYVGFAQENLFPGQEIDKAKRTYTKPVLIGTGYGQQGRGMSAYAAGMGVEMSVEEAQRCVDTYHRAFPEIRPYWRHIEGQVRQHGVQQLPSGRLLTYPDLRHERGERGPQMVYSRHQIFSKTRNYRDDVRLWHGALVENCVQAVARDVVMEQTLWLAKDWKVVLSAHDEVVLCVPEDQAERAKSEAEAAFATPPQWAEGLPLVGEAIISKDYGEKP